MNRAWLWDGGDGGVDGNGYEGSVLGRWDTDGSFGEYIGSGKAVLPSLAI